MENGVRAGSAYYDRLREIATAAEEATAAVDLISWGTKQTFTEQIEDGAVKVGELRDRAEELQAKIGELEGKSYLTGAQKTELAGLREDLEGVNADIQGVISSTDEMVKRFILGMVEMQIAADREITPAESDFYVRLAAEFGLVDDAAIEMRSTVLGVLADVQAGTISPEEGIRALGDAALDVQAPLTELGTTGAGALDDLGLSAETALDHLSNVGPAAETAMGRVGGAAGSARAALIDVGLAAEEAQSKIDAMHGKELEIDIRFNVPEIPHRAVGSIGAPVSFNADGGFVQTGTLGVVGEEGPELIVPGPRGTEVIPLGNAPSTASTALAAPLGSSGTRSGGDGAMLGGITINISGVTDPEEVARVVDAKLRPYMQAVRLR
jgi:hypothetical protein